MIPNVLIDTDVVLDVFLDRAPHNGHSKAVMALLGQKGFYGHITATIVVNIQYHVRKHVGKENAIQCVRDLLRSKEIEIHAVDRQTLTAALNSGMTDFEDAVQAVAAEIAGIDLIVTRNQRDFRHSPVPAVSPEEFLEKLL
jgi:predicted nucleic acid-binding protein